MLTTAALTGFKNYVTKTVSYARYKVGSTYYKTDISKVYVNSEGKDCIVATNREIDEAALYTVTE